MSSHVARLDMVLAIDRVAQPRTQALRDQVERRMVPRILEACEAHVHQRLGPQAILAVRRLSVTWTLDEVQLGDAGYLSALGESLAQELVDQHQRAGAMGPHATLVLFRSEAHRRALLIQERLSGQSDAWYHRARPAQPFQDWLRRGKAAAEELLHELLRLRIEVKLAPTLSVETLRALAEILAPQHWPPAFVAALPLDTSERESNDEVTTASLDWLDLMPGPLSPSSGAERGADLPARGVLGMEPPVGSPMDTGPTLDPVAPTARRSAPGPAVNGPRPAADPPWTAAPLGPDREMDGRGPNPQAGSRGSKQAAGQAAAPQVSAAGSDAHELPGLGAVATGFAGLFYLVRRVQALELAEALWQIGAREGLVLAHTAALLLGDSEDPAAALFGGQRWGRPLPPCPNLEPWALEELEGTLDARLGMALGPVAQAWAAALPQATEAAKRLLGHCAAALSVDFRRRLEQDVQACGLPWLVQRGRLLLPEETLIVAMPMSAVDLALRRAGLDQNPGWAPWMERRVELVFEGGNDPW